MSTPGFTAERALTAASAAISSAKDVTAAGYAPSAGQVLPQSLHWGSFTEYACIGDYVKASAAIIWGIPWGQSWVDACAGLPGQPPGYNYPVDPQHCCTQYVAGIAVNEWGYWILPDRSCGPKPASSLPFPLPCWVPPGD